LLSKINRNLSLKFLRKNSLNLNFFFVRDAEILKQEVALARKSLVHLQHHRLVDFHRAI
jgi:hypothetical protein